MTDPRIRALALAQQHRLAVSALDADDAEHRRLIARNAEERAGLERLLAQLVDVFGDLLDEGLPTSATAAADVAAPPVATSRKDVPEPVRPSAPDHRPSPRPRATLAEMERRRDAVLAVLASGGSMTVAMITQQLRVAGMDIVEHNVQQLVTKYNGEAFERSPDGRWKRKVQPELDFGGAQAG